jgi:hypothetical protein
MSMGSDKWHKATYTYLSLTTNGFPNIFVPMVLRLQLRLSIGPACAEFQGDWIVRAIQMMQACGIKSIDPTSEAEKNLEG